MELTVSKKFWSQVVKTEDKNECWLWQGKRVGEYGVLYANSRQILAHRLSWVFENGPFPERDNGTYHGWVVMHSCDNPLCVNPAHLRLGTQSENVRDMDAKGRRVPHGKPGELHHNARFTEDDVRRIRNDPRAHSTVAREYQTSAAEIHYIRTQGWSNIPKPDIQYEDGRALTSRGNANPNSRLTEEIVRAIRASDAKPGVLAKQYGIKPDTVTKIRRRLSWAHVE